MNKCKNCKNECTDVYCSNKCQIEYQRTYKLNEWLSGNNVVRKGGNSVFGWMRDYLFKEVNYQCSECGWNKINEYTGTIPLEVDHIDGNAYNNLKENLRVLCPNCHSLKRTSKNIGSRISYRSYRRK